MKPKKKTPKPKTCPDHGGTLTVARTQYGRRWACPVRGCTVVCWEGSGTSRPADAETRQLRHAAHEAFDPMWESGAMSRSAAYRALAEHLGLPVRKTHIGFFNKDECAKAIAFAQEWLAR